MTHDELISAVLICLGGVATIWVYSASVFFIFTLYELYVRLMAAWYLEPILSLLIN